MALSRVLVLATALLGCGHDSPSSPDASTDSDVAARCGVATAGPARERVVTTGGTVHGVALGASFAYLGVRYAAPPTGSLRFAAPAPTGCTADADLDATALGPKCPQLDDSDVFQGDEDCLRVNIWAPAAAPSTPRAVMVWIHGGANAVGFASDPLYDGQKLAEAGDVVVVTLDYRVGQLGFVDHATLAAESSASGNYGLLDQIAALGWVHDNIAGFGGDPTNVTVFGESAGGRDTCSVVAAPSSAGLFTRSIIESGSCSALPTRTIAQAQGNTFVSAAGCAAAADVPACLRALPTETLIRAAAPDPSILVSTAYQPVIDGTIQPVEPITALANGSAAHGPFMLGSNADETGATVGAIPDEDAYTAALVTQFGATAAPKVKLQYPVARFTTPRAAFVRATTDARFVCPTRSMARAAHTGSQPPVYRYLFDDPASPFGAVHGIEIPFVFGTFSALLTPTGQPYQPTATDLAVAAAVQADWVSFAKTGAPSGTPAWPAWDTTDPARHYTAAGADVQVGIRTDDCDFWDNLLAQQ